MGTTQAEAGAGSGVSTDKDGPPSTIALAVEGRRGSLPDDGFAASGGLRICFKVGEGLFDLRFYSESARMLPWK
jgi:hypothetical protein